MSAEIRTSHAGSLPRTPKLIDANAAKADAAVSDAEFGDLLEASVVDIVQKQKDLGITELSSMPANFSMQTGHSRFAAEDICQGQLGDCCK